MNAEAVQDAPVSRATAWKIVASVVAVVGGVGGLLYFSAAPEMTYYKYVDEVTAHADQFRGKRLRVHGYVKDGSLKQIPGTLEYRFEIETRAPRGKAVIAAEYRGLVPDNFKAGAEVVAKGTLTADNRLVVVPDGIEAKCPSKYEGGDLKVPEAAGGPAAAKGQL